MLLRHLYITDLRRLAQGRSNTMMEKIFQAIHRGLAVGIFIFFREILGERLVHIHCPRITG